MNVAHLCISELERSRSRSDLVSECIGEFKKADLHHFE